ncbi:MAG: PKD domain-containing protein, partial [Desulfobacterales bacterium]
DGTIAWQKTYGGTGDEEARGVQEAVDGGYIVVGSTSSFGGGNKDVWLLKLNTDGSVAWEKTYGGIDDDGGLDVQLTTDGEYIIAGPTESFGDGQVGLADMWVLRLDQTGEIYDCTSIDTGTDITVADTGVLPAGPTVVVQGGTLNLADTVVTPSDTSGSKSLVCSESVSPVALFSADPVEGGNPLTVQFTDQSKGLITDYLWDFGDETLSADQNPVHTYTNIGTYTVKLTVTGPAGTDKQKQIDYINVTQGLPIADFTATPTVGIPDFVVEFTDQSSEKWGIIYTYFWDFGDGSTAYGDRAFHRYTSDGPFTVSLTVTGPGGSDTKTRTNYIHTPGYRPLYPVVERIKPRKPQPGDKITILGYNFDQDQGDSVVHVNGRTFSSSNSKRIKLWTDTKIIIRLPTRWYPCEWFKGKNYRFRKAWVTVGAEDSNQKRFRLYKPDACP